MRLARAALALAVGNILSRALGLVREQVIAILFGRSAVTDAFTAAWRVPTTLYDFLLGGAISAALVPVLAEARDDRAGFGRVVSALLTLSALFFGLASLLTALVADPLMAIWAPGLSTAARAEVSGAVLLRLMTPALLLMGLSGVTTAALYAQERFLLPALAAASFNGAIIVSALVFHQQLGIVSLCLGLVLGTLVQLAIQAPGLRGARLRVSFEFSHPALRRMLALYLPVALGLVVSTIGVAIDTNLASTTPPGDLTAMRYATTLVQFPLGLIATALSFAILPSLARASEEFADLLGLGIRLAWLGILPAAVGLVVLREPLIRLIFQHGAFGAEDTARTALAFLCYSPGIPAAAIDQLLIFAFYARKNTVVPVLVGVAAVGVYVVTGVTLVGPFGMPGLAAANSLQWVSHALMMTVLLPRVLPAGQHVPVLAGAWRPALAVAVMAAAVILFDQATGMTSAGGGGWTLGLSLAVAGVLGVGAYGGTLVALRTPEIWATRDLVRRRLAGRPVPAGD